MFKTIQPSPTKTIRNHVHKNTTPLKSALWDPEEEDFPEASPFRWSKPPPKDSMPTHPISNECPTSPLIVAQVQSRRTANTEDDEFPDWASTYKSTYGTFKPTEGPHPLPQPTHAISSISIIPTTTSLNLDLTLQSEEHIRDVISELLDPACSDPAKSDIHDQLVSRFFASKYHDLPADYPARHMHVLHWSSYLSPNDRVMRSVRPRLCDGIATVLFETDEQCLEEFLDPGVKVFEWRHCVGGSSRGVNVVIRRVGNEVLCGAYRNHGFKYFWNLYLKSRIDFTGKWSEVFAGCRGTTPTTKIGPAWDHFESVNPKDGEEQDPKDAKYALYLGRQLALHLLGGQYWGYVEDYGEIVEWEADGKVTSGNVKRRTDRYGDADGD